MNASVLRRPLLVSGSLLLFACSVFGDLDELSNGRHDGGAGAASEAGKCVPGGDCGLCETCVAYCGCAKPDAFAACVASCPGAAGAAGSAGAGASGGAAGTAGAGGAGGFGGQAGSGGMSDLCQSCLTQFCKNELDTCTSNTECAALFQCLAACTSQVCADQCTSDYPGGVAPYGELAKCAQAQCSLECS